MNASHVAGFVVSALIAVFFAVAIVNDGTNSQGKVLCLMIGLPALYFAVLNAAHLLGAQ